MDEKGGGHMSRPRFRRHFLWDTVQPRFLCLSLCYVVVVIVAVSAALFVPLMLELNHLPLSSVEAQRVAEQFELLHSRFWPVVVVVSLLLIVHGVFFSHRIAGPLYRFRRIFQSVASGDLTVRTSIRKSDYLHVEAQCLGEMVNALREKIGRIEAHHADMAPQLERLKAAAARVTPGVGSERIGRSWYQPFQNALTREKKSWVSGLLSPPSSSNSFKSSFCRAVRFTGVSTASSM